MNTIITKTVADQWTDQFLDQLKDKRFYQRNASAEYASFLAVENYDVFDWKAINAAIMNKWSVSGLVKIEEAAWKIYRGEK